MPVKSSKQWGKMGRARQGLEPDIPPSVAAEMMEKTPPAKRKRFAKAAAKRRGKGKGKKAPAYRSIGQQMMEG